MLCGLSAEDHILEVVGILWVYRRGELWGCTTAVRESRVPAVGGDMVVAKILGFPKGASDG